MFRSSLYAVALLVATLAAPALMPQEASAAVFYRSGRAGYYGGGYRSYGYVNRGYVNRGYVGYRGGYYGGRYYR